MSTYDKCRTRCTPLFFLFLSFLFVRPPTLVKKNRPPCKSALLASSRDSCFRASSFSSHHRPCADREETCIDARRRLKGGRRETSRLDDAFPSHVRPPRSTISFPALIIIKDRESERRENEIPRYQENRLLSELGARASACTRACCAICMCIYIYVYVYIYIYIYTRHFRFSETRCGTRTVRGPPIEREREGGRGGRERE